MSKSKLAIFLLAILLPCFPLASEDRALILDISGSGDGAEAQGYSKFLAEAIQRGLLALTPPLKSSIQKLGAPPGPEEIQALATEAGARWVFGVASSFDGTRMAWTGTAWDSEDASVFGYDSYASRPGPAALPLIEDSAQRLLAYLDRLAKLDKVTRDPGRSLFFTSQDEDALVSLGNGTVLPSAKLRMDGNEVELGRIAGGELHSPSLPLKLGQVLTITVQKPGFWPLVTKIKVKEKGAIPLPRLVPLTVKTWGVDYGLGRLLGAEVLARAYTLPDQVFLELATAPYITYDFLPGSYPIFHQEFGLSFFFTPFFRPGAKLRLVVGAGAQFYFTAMTAPKVDPRLAGDIVLAPFQAGLEYQGRGMTFFLRARGLYSLGLDGGALERKWLMVGPRELPSLSLGVLFK